MDGIASSVQRKILEFSTVLKITALLRKFKNPNWDLAKHYRTTVAEMCRIDGEFVARCNGGVLKAKTPPVSRWGTETGEVILWAGKGPASR